MRLRGRFALWFSVAALLPIVAAAVVTRTFLSRSLEQEYEAERANAEAKLDDGIAKLRQAVAGTVTGIAVLEDNFVGATVTQLGRHDGVLPPSAVKELRKSARVKMNGLQLDFLVVLDGLDQVLASPHNPSMFDERNPVYAQRAQALGDRTFFAREQIATSGREGDSSRTTIEETLVVEAAVIVRDLSERVAVAGAKVVPADLVVDLRRSGLDTRLVDAGGKVLVAPATDWGGLEGSVIRTPLRGADGAPVAWIELASSRAELDELLGSITRNSALIAGAAVIVCLLLGLIVGRRMTRDLDHLVVGVQAAARGDLDHQVPVRTGDEIGTLSRAVNAMMVDLKESKERLAMAERVAAWQEIARRLAHEIKNPLTPIQMSVETLRKTWAKKHPSFDEIFEESTATVLEEAGRLKRIVSEFSEFARMPKPKKVPLDLNELVTQTTALYRGTVTIELELGEIPEIEADRDSLSQVILNLVENARDAVSGANGGSSEKIRIATLPTRTRRAVALIIDDNGPGIPAAVKERLFTPYFTTKHATGGSGLGLAIVHRIVSDHDGTILATESSLGGARFVIELPTREATADDLAASVAGQIR